MTDFRFKPPKVFSPLEEGRYGAHESGKEIVGGVLGVRATYPERAELVSWQPPWATSKQNKLIPDSTDSLFIFVRVSGRTPVAPSTRPFPRESGGGGGSLL